MIPVVLRALAWTMGNAADAEGPRPSHDAPPAPAAVVDAAPAPEPAPPPPAAFSGNSTGSAAWRSNNHDQARDNDNYGFAVVKHAAMLDAGDTRMSLRVDHETVVHNPRDAVGGFPDRRNAIRLERVALDLTRRWRSLVVQATAGDFYAQFGRGLVLAVRKYDELGLDFALRGGKVQAGLLEDRLVVTLLAGAANVNNVIPETDVYLADPQDHLGGASVEVRPAEWLTVGAHSALVWGGDPQDTNLDGLPDRKEENRTLNTSAATEATLGSWVVGAEYARQARRPDRSPIERGSALFATATGPVGPLTALIEVKDYRQFHQLNALSGVERARILYSLSPTAERIDQEITDNTDVTGGRLRLDLVVGAAGATTLHASAGAFNYRFEQLHIQHGFAGSRTVFDSGGALSLTGGYRRGVNPQGAITLSMIQLECDLLLPLTSHLGIHANVRPERVLKDGIGPFLRGTSLAELDWRSRFAVGGGLDWTREGASRVTSDPLPTYYPFGLVRVRPSDSLVVQLFVGSQKGGLKCFGGVCRSVPPFAGARLDVTVRF